MSLTQKVIDANIALHSRLAAEYESSEPHFRAENVAKVTRRIVSLVSDTRAKRLLDLGCGTGFMINIAKQHVSQIVGVDVTQAMLDRVDTAGPAAIELVRQDSGAYEGSPASFEIVTAYSFLHHLADVMPTFRTASRALVNGGKFYADLEPNWHFWSGIRGLPGHGAYHPLVRREIEAVTAKDEEVQARFGIDREVFNHAEYGKDIVGGFKEEMVAQQLKEAGFSGVTFHYDWFLGEGFLINSGKAPREELLNEAASVSAALQRALPLSSVLFKYLGFVATK
jgi:ubiquinone/menaquinone biosynthesis C-methylase UbiE